MVTVHKRYSGVMVSVSNVIDFNNCSVYNGNQTVVPRVESIDIGSESVQCIDKLCYLGDRIGAEGSSIARVRSGWKKLRELHPF